MGHSAVNLPLHGGDAPYWLIRRMVPLSEVIVQYICEEKGPNELLLRLNNPGWFQSLGCVLGFDWHSSGLTTTTTGALKTAITNLNTRSNIGIYCAGGKGKTSLKTPDEIEQLCKLTGQDHSLLISASRMTAKIDNSCVQDGYSLYHHSFFFDEKSNFTVVQQGMSQNGWARRYHWHSPEDWFCSAQKISGTPAGKVLNMSSIESSLARSSSVDIVREYPAHHEVLRQFLTPKELAFLEHIYDIQPGGYDDLIMFRNFGPKKVRALALASKLIFGTDSDWKDPVKYSFAHGGKDGTPFPVDRKMYDENIILIREALESRKQGDIGIDRALRRLSEFE